MLVYVVLLSEDTFQILSNANSLSNNLKPTFYTLYNNDVQCAPLRAEAAYNRRIHGAGSHHNVWEPETYIVRMAS